MPGFLARYLSGVSEGGNGHLDNIEAAEALPALITDPHAEDPDVPPASPTDQELQGLAVLVGEDPLVSLLTGEEREDERSDLDQEDSGHWLSVSHPRQSVRDCQPHDPPDSSGQGAQFPHCGSNNLSLCHSCSDN